MSVERGAIGWFLLAALLGCVIMLELSSKLKIIPTAAVDATKRIDAVVPIEEVPSIAARPRENMLDGILARPLFSASRRPGKTSSDVSSAELIGVMEVDGAQIVLFSHPEEGALIRRKGDALAGWEVGDIEDFRVSVKREREVEWLDLRKHVPSPTEDQSANVRAESFEKGPEWGSPELRSLFAEAKLLVAARDKERRQLEELEEFAKEAERLR